MPALLGVLTVKNILQQIVINSYIAYNDFLFYFRKNKSSNADLTKVFENVKILINNSTYRVSDLYFQSGIRWEQDRNEVLCNPVYHDTIMYNYLKYKTKEQDFHTFRDVVQNHIKYKMCAAPSADTLVIHMRLGDITEVPARYYDCLRTYSRFYSQIPIGSIPVNKVEIVTALHFGANYLNNSYFYSEVAKNRSFGILENMFKLTSENGLNCDVISNTDIDDDFCYMASSKFFVRGKSGFSDLVASCLSKDAIDFVI